MTSDDKLQDYLWDPAAEPDPDVAAFERRLSAVSFDPDARPLALPQPSPRPMWRRSLVPLALAATVLIAAGFGLWTWRLNWPEGRAWTVRSQSSEEALEVGRGMTVPQQATANIGRIGTMRLGGGTSFELRYTRGTRHRLRMSAGNMHVRVWAPPASVVVETPVGEVIDMGCEFLLTVSDTVTRVQVLSGWVQLENAIDEVLVPAGASTEMNGTAPPGVPVFDDAAAGFREAIRSFEQDERSAMLGAALSLARVRDMYTLLQLADRHPSSAEPILRRAAELSPPPGDVTVGGIVRGDRNGLWQWANSLPLPSPKSSWWRNWRDAIPLWIGR